VSGADESGRDAGKDGKSDEYHSYVGFQSIKRIPLASLSLYLFLE
jgi:hypothetical protein